MPRRIIDCTKPLQHGLNNNFVAHEFERAGEPRTIAHHIQMESDVGTHVVAGRRFASWGSAIGDLRVDTFFGEGVLGKLPVSLENPDIDAEKLEQAFGRRLQNGDIAILATGPGGSTPRLTAQATQWLLVRGVKLLALANDIEVGRENEPDDERVILSVLLESDIPVVRNLHNTTELSEERLACMAIPAAVDGVSSWPVRFIALDPGQPPDNEQSLGDTQPTDVPSEGSSADGEGEQRSTKVSDEDSSEPNESSRPLDSSDSPSDPDEKTEESDSKTSEKRPETAD